MQNSRYNKNKLYLNKPETKNIYEIKNNFLKQNILKSIISYIKIKYIYVYYCGYDGYAKKKKVKFDFYVYKL